MPNSSMLKAKGLFTFSNFLSSVPEGALTEASNVVIDRDGIIEPRRGIKNYASVGNTTITPIKQLFVYKNRILSFINSKLYFDDGSSTFTAFSSDLTNPFSFTAPSAYRIKGIETQGNFYFTTNDGIKKISVADASDLLTTPGNIPKVTAAGGIRAADIELSLDLNTQNGFLLPNNRVAYRIVWATKDANTNLILGYPSSNTQIHNSSSIGYGVTLDIQVPQQLIGNADYFYQIYRSNITTADTASDELNLIYESAYDGVATSLTVQDNTPEDIRNNGTTLYINEYSGSGIKAANSAPPKAHDVTLYKNIAFYANTTGKHNISFNLQGMDGLLEFNGLSTTPNKILSLVYAAGSTTITLDGTGHAFPNTQTQDVVLFQNNSASAVIVAATFPTNNTIVVPGDFSLYSPSITSVFTSVITVHHQFPQIATKFYFVGRPTRTNLFVATNKAGMTALTSFKLHSADEKIKYMFWYKINTSDVQPSLPTGYVPAVINITDAGIITAAQVMNATIDAINNTGSFVAVEDTGTPNQIDIVTSDSGKVLTAPSFITPSAGWTITQVLDGIGEDITAKFIKLSSFISVGQAIESTAKSFTKVIDRNVTDFNLYYASSVSDLPGLINGEATGYTTPEFLFTANIVNHTDNTLGTGAMFNAAMGTTVNNTSLYSASEVHKNRVYYSKSYEPESVPALNYIDIGPKDKEILRVIALRDSLFILKEEGIYRLTGANADNFYVALFDSSTNLVAPDTAAVLNNQVYMLSSQGVATVTETGVGIISRPIENIFTRITTSEFPNFATASFGATYESDRAYLLFTVFNKNDTYATKAYRYNTFTQAWTSWDVNARSAIVNPALNINKLYIGTTTNQLDVERKTLTRRDYADKEYSLEISEDGLSGNSMRTSSVANLGIGDILIQTQYLTTSQFDQLLRQLDTDAGLPTHNFYNAYKVNVTDNIARNLRNLTSHLNSLDNTITVTSGNVNFATVQTEYNTLVSQLNNPTTITALNNYKTSSGTTEYELVVSAVNPYNNIISSNHITPLLAGPVTAYKAIPTKVTWAPFSFGEPSMLKHVRSGTMMFEHATLTAASLGYSTDLSPGFDTVDFHMEGDGSFGNNVWDNFTWGGEGSGVPMRTLIPRQKQRCRFIKAQFLHQVSFDKFSIIGISYTFEMTSDRAYR